MQQTIRLPLIMAFSFCLLGCSTENSVEQGNKEVALHKSDSLSIHATLKVEKLDYPIPTDTTSSGTADTVAIITDKDVYLLEPTSYHGDEVEKSWENLPWYGLFKLSEREFELRATNLSIQSVHDDIVDDDGVDTGWQVKVHDKDTLPLLLIGGKIAIKERKLRGKFPDYSVLLPDSTLVIDAHYQLSAFGNSRLYSQETGENELFNYGLELRGGDMRQKLFSHYRFIGDGPYLVWHGYLDEDTIPDLLIDCTNNYNQRVLVLFLSTKAKEGQIVRPVAMIASVGC